MHRLHINKSNIISDFGYFAKLHGSLKLRLITPTSSLAFKYNDLK